VAIPIDLGSGHHWSTAFVLSTRDYDIRMRSLKIPQCRDSYDVSRYRGIGLLSFWQMQVFAM